MKINETHEGEPQTTNGSPSLCENPETIDNINIDLYAACKGYFVNPYKAFLNVRRVLDTFGLNMPMDKYHLLGDEEDLTIPIAQYKDATNEHTHYLVFSYVMDEYGYEVYAELTDESGLQEISQMENDG